MILVRHSSSVCKFGFLEQFSSGCCLVVFKSALSGDVGGLRLCGYNPRPDVALNIASSQGTKYEHLDLVLWQQ